jgi:hypothetical protein
MNNRNIFFLHVLFLSLFISACTDSETAVLDSEVAETQGTTVVTNDSTVNESNTSTAEELTDDISLEDVHEDESDYVYNDADITQIILSNSGITIEGDGAIAEGNSALINSAGTFRVSGSIDDGQLQIDVADSGIVQVILAGASISSSLNSAIYVIQSPKTVFELEAGTITTLTDAASYTFAILEDEEPNATFFSHDDMTIFGTGELVIQANFADGIVSKDGLLIKEGTYSISAVDDGIRGKDYLVIENGSFNVTAGGDGIKSTETDAESGYVEISDGNFVINSGSDAVQAENNLLVDGGVFTLQAETGKGLKAVSNITITGGTFAVNSADDAVHCNGDVIINGGDFTISTDDDGVHADSTLIIGSGNIIITDSYEGIESRVITINGGYINITASDDGLNVAGGTDASSPNFPRETVSTNSGFWFYMNGGTVVIVSQGDGVDVNGSAEVTDGTILVSQTGSGNGPVDYDGSFSMTGGLLIAAGSSDMSQNISSGINAVLVYLNSQSANTLFNIQNTSGTEIVTFAPAQTYASVVVASADMQSGSYIYYTGGSHSGINQDGLYLDGVYTPGTAGSTFSVSGQTTVGSGGMNTRP